jgi:hypothetical protein
MEHVEEVPEEEEVLKGKKIKLVDNTRLPIIRQLVDETGCSIVKIDWRSKYNSYVVYDYEPFCSDGFELEVFITSSNKNNLEFLSYLLKKHYETVSILNKVLQEA